MKISVRVKPGSKIEKVEFDKNSREATIWTRAKAHDGEANKAVVEIISKELGVAKTRIEIVSGEKSKNKIVEIAEL